MRACKLCGKEKQLEEFASAGTINGVKYYRWKCIPCYSKFKQIRKDKIKKWFFDFKNQFSCKECGENDIRTLDFDHLNPSEKSFNMGDALKRGFSLEKILKEATKCQVLCANCHRKKTLAKYFVDR